MFSISDTFFCFLIIFSFINILAASDNTKVGVFFFYRHVFYYQLQTVSRISYGREGEPNI